MSHVDEYEEYESGERKYQSVIVDIGEANGYWKIRFDKKI